MRRNLVIKGEIKNGVVVMGWMGLYHERIEFAAYSRLTNQWVAYYA